MSKSVRDYMSSRLVYLAEGARPSLALQPMLELGISAVPVLDEHHSPIGVVALRDLVEHREEVPRMTTPAFTVGQDASIEEAAEAMIAAGTHHLVAVDASLHAVGMLSALDILRAFAGKAAAHPPALERFAESR